MPAVELVAFDGCPNRERARENLRAALGEAGLPAVWRELDPGDPDLPVHARGYGSPTILVDGRDVAGYIAPGGQASCRLYRGPAGDHGAPSVATILAALRREAFPPDAEVAPS